MTTPRQLRALRDLAGALAIDREFYPSWETLGQLLPGEEVVAAWHRLEVGRSPIGAYLHIPLCPKKCTYCHFPSHVPAPGEVTEVVDRLVIEMRLFGPALASLQFDTLYVGGGTPSMLPPDDLRRLLRAAREQIPLRPGAQLTVEVSPMQLDPHRARALAEEGVNRVSMGVQSLDPEVLARVNRGDQCAADVRAAIEDLRRAGIPNICTDLMVGLPGQSADSFRASVSDLIDLAPDVIHVYPFEARGSALERSGLRQTGEDLATAHAALAGAEPLLREAGYDRTVNETVYARSLEHLNRYDYDRYLQAGSVASFGDDAYGHVFGQLSYAATDSPQHRRALERGELPPYLALRTDLDHEMREHVAFNLKHGIDRAAFAARFGHRLEGLFAEELRTLEEAGWVRLNEERLEPRFDSQPDAVAAGMLFIPTELLTAYVQHVAPERAAALLPVR